MQRGFLIRCDILAYMYVCVCYICIIFESSTLLIGSKLCSYLFIFSSEIIDSKHIIYSVSRFWPCQSCSIFCRCRPPPSFFRNGHIYMKNAQCAETNENFIFQILRFLFYELWMILYSNSTESS